MATQDEIRRFRKLFDLRLDQVDRVERRISSDLRQAHAEKLACDRRLAMRLLALERQLPWRRTIGGEVVDPSKPREIARVRRKMMDAIDQEYERLERPILPPSLRGT